MGFRTATQATAGVKERTKPGTRGDDAPAKKVNALKVMSGLADGMLPDQKYIQDGLRNGTITRQSVGMKSIVVDTSFQARVPQDNGKHFNMEHVRKLAAIRDADDGKPLAPIVLFLDRGTRKYYIADGFHRHEENRLRKYADISAYVVDVEDWRHEATLFAAMCNQAMCLPRRQEDIRKAVELLLEDPICQSWPVSRIARHCGLATSTASRYKVAFFLERGIKMPDVVQSDGKSRPAGSYPKQYGMPRITSNGVRGDGKTNYYSRVAGKRVYLGTDRKEAEKRLNDAVVGTLRVSLELVGFQRWVARRGISLNISGVCSSSYPHIRGFFAEGVVLTTAELDEAESFPWAYGCVHALRRLVGKPDDRMIVVCYRHGRPVLSFDLYRKLGVEFLTPDELVASLKGD